jgi:hypothetical protein
MSKDTGQIRLFAETDDDEEVWKEEWQDMPEFIQEDLTPLKSLVVHFQTRQDRDAFSKLIGQKITYKTKSIWYSPDGDESKSKQIYVDGNEI